MRPTVLLVNPPIYDFAAYDFWLKPYGLLRAAGLLRGSADMVLYDAMDRQNPDFPAEIRKKTNEWGCGPYPRQRVEKPAVFNRIPRLYNRFGTERGHFQAYLAGLKRIDAVLIQTSLTYWYPGVREAIEDVRRFHPAATIVLGGFYATCCPDHARSLGADVVIKGDDVSPMLEHFGVSGASEGLPVWEQYRSLKTGVIKLTQGCPFGCAYCYVPQSGVTFAARPVEACLEELDLLVRCGAENVAFYDDALLVWPEKALFGFLEGTMRKGYHVNFHTPNALHARFLTAQAAELMVRAGVKTFYLGFESRSEAFHDGAGAKVVSDDLVAAVDNLRRAGVEMHHITAYEMLGHPRFEAQQLEGSMRFASSLGIRVMLSDFSPIPGTPDGELCRGVVDLDEPLCHSKTAYPILSLGHDTVGYYKDLCRGLNDQQRQAAAKAFTLIEVLMVLAILSLLLAILTPALRCVKQHAAASVCLSHISQLSKCWMLYAEDYNGYFADGDVSDELGEHAGYSFYDRAAWGERNRMRVHNWVGRPRGPNGEDQNETLADKLRGLEVGALWPYVRQHKVYHCPADRRHLAPALRPMNNMADPPGPWLGGYRSYSLGKPLSRLPGSDMEMAIEIQRTTQFISPASKVVFIEEMDGYGWNQSTWVMFLAQPRWIDPFGALHDGGSTLSFADGHAVVRKWVDPQTVRMAEAQAKFWMATDPTNGSMEDYDWFRKAYIPGR